MLKRYHGLTEDAVNEAYEIATTGHNVEHTIVIWNGLVPKSSTNTESYAFVRFVVRVNVECIPVECEAVTFSISSANCSFCCGVMHALMCPLGHHLSPQIEKIIAFWRVCRRLSSSSSSESY